MSDFTKPGEILVESGEVTGEERSALIAKEVSFLGSRSVLDLWSVTILIRDQHTLTSTRSHSPSQEVLLWMVRCCY